jgi:hypothetical protein
MFQEITGLPMAYMELTDGTNFIKFTYRAIGAGGFPSYSSALEYLDGLRQKLYQAFPKKAQEDNTCVVIWRTPPVIERINNKRVKNAIYIYARFATSPPIHEEFWKKYEKLEGNSLRDYRTERPK